MIRGLGPSVWCLQRPMTLAGIGVAARVDGNTLGGQCRLWQPVAAQPRAEKAGGNYWLVKP